MTVARVVTAARAEPVVTVETVGPLVTVVQARRAVLAVLAARAEPVARGELVALVVTEEMVAPARRAARRPDTSVTTWAADPANGNGRPGKSRAPMLASWGLA